MTKRETPPVRDTTSLLFLAQLTLTFQRKWVVCTGVVVSSSSTPRLRTSPLLM